MQDEAFYRTLWATISGGKTWHGRMVNKRKDGTHYTEDATHLAGARRGRRSSRATSP